VTVRVAAPPSALDRVSGILHFERLGGAVSDASREADLASSATGVAAEVPGRTEVVLEAGAVWRLVLEAPGLWAPPIVWHAGSSGRVEIEAAPTGRLSGTLEAEDGAPSPKRWTARFRAVARQAGETPSERHTLPCRLEDDGTFECELPAGRHDVSLRAPGFVSHHLWDVAIDPRSPLAVGPLRLVRGASVVAWLRIDGAASDIDVTRTRVQLLPAISGVDDVARGHDRQRLLQIEGRPNERGFVEFAGVTPGSYLLRASHPAFAETRFGPIVVAPGAETEVHEVVLQKPVRLAIDVSPPRDGRGRAWFVALARHSEVPGHLDRVAAGGVDEEGEWSASRLDPGRYRLTIADAEGSRWLTREVELDRDEELLVELPIERVEGRVLLGGEPLAGARLWFGGRHGETRIAASTNEDGAAFLFLPVHEDWQVEVRVSEPPVSAKLDAVPVADHPTQPWRIVEIELPNTGLGGTVTQPDGSAVAEATVRLLREDPPPRFFARSTDADGRFGARAIETGAWRLQAEWIDGESRRWLSDGVGVDLREDVFERVDLVLRRTWTFSGQIVAPSGDAVYGAEVTGVPVYAGPGERATAVDSAVTGLGGEFELQLPAEATAVRLTVLPPGFAARQWPPFEKGSPPQILTVDPHGGTLRLVGLPAPADAVIEDQPEVFGLDRWSLATLVRWSRMVGGPTLFRGGELAVPAMAAGRYTLCAQPEPSSERAARPCVSGELLPHSELRLALPAP
jgi:hypothetical protein